MKKTLLTILGVVALTAFAQTPRVEIFELQGDLVDSLPGSTVQGVSLNGEWAVGYGSEYCQKSFIWNRTTGEFSLLTGSYLDQAYAAGVSNDGTVVGAYCDTIVITASNDTIQRGSVELMIAGYWKDSVWTALPMENGFEYTSGLEANVNGEARFISADGSVITGYIHSNTFKRNFYDESTGAFIETRTVSLLRPAVWTRKADGTYKLERKSQTMPTGDELQQGIWANYGASQDGKVIPVVADHPTGSRSPAVIVDGELIRIYGKEDINPALDETQYFYDGVAVTCSPDGRYVPGYWDFYGNGYDIVGFVYDTETDSLEEIPGWAAATVALDDGTLYGFDGYMGTALFRTADKSFNGTLSDYLNLYYDGYNGNLPQTIFSVSADGRTIGGWYAVADAIGAVMYPSIVVLNGDPNAEPNSVAALAADRRSIITLGNEVVAPGAATIQLYAPQGTLLAETSADRLSTVGHHGVLIIKATYPDGKVEIRKCCKG